MKKEYIKFLIRFLILFIVVEGLIMLNFIVFSDNPLTWSEFLRGIPYMLLACLAVVFFRGLVFMSPTSKKDSKRHILKQNNTTLTNSSPQPGVKP